MMMLEEFLNGRSVGFDEGLGGWHWCKTGFDEEWYHMTTDEVNMFKRLAMVTD